MVMAVVVVVVMVVIEDVRTELSDLPPVLVSVLTDQGVECWCPVCV